jgi:hypothetical protein
MNTNFHEECKRGWPQKGTKTETVFARRKEGRKEGRMEGRMERRRGNWKS